MKKTIHNRGVKSNKLDPSDFYYTDEGLIVFTELFHLKRGNCCGSGCKHCPYSPKHLKGNTLTKKTN